MSCMCGDLYCNSCGPAQGNHKCSICGAWSNEGGCKDPDLCEEALEYQCSNCGQFSCSGECLPQDGSLCPDCGLNDCSGECLANHLAHLASLNGKFEVK